MKKKVVNPTDKAAIELFNISNIDLTQSIKQTKQINNLYEKLEDPNFLKKSLAAKKVKANREAKKNKENQISLESYLDKLLERLKT